MKLANLNEMATKNLNISFKDDNVDLVYGRKRLTIYSIEGSDGEYIFSATKNWDAPSLTVKAKNPKDAFNTVRKSLEAKIYGAFSGATQGAKNASKQLGLL